MKRFARALAAAAAVFAIAIASPSSALAFQHEIGITGLTPLEVGRGTAIKAEGTVAPPTEYLDESWILAVAIPASVMTDCPADASSAGVTAEQVGTILAIAMRPNTDANGNFTNVIGYTPLAAGPVLICAYLYNEVGYTWGYSYLHLEVIKPGGGVSGAPPVHPGPAGPAGTGAPAGAPVNTVRPWVTSYGRNLRCHPGTWSNATGYAYRWYFDGRATRITGPQAVSLGRGNRGHKVSCRVTAYGPGEVTATALSPPLRLR